jgi:hypothetical protein
MRKLSALALIAVALCCGDARAVDIKNVRATYGPFGAVRPDNKVLPGDVFRFTFDIVDITVDPKYGATKYTMKLEVIDPAGKEVYKESANKGLLLGLGGKVVPEDAHVVLGADLNPGTYTARVTITDPGNKTEKKLDQKIEVLKKDFGFIHVMAPSVGFKGQDYGVSYKLVGMSRDNKKIPRITVSMRVLDESGTPTSTQPIVNKIPDDLPEVNIKQDFISLYTPIFLNRTGRFTVEIKADDDLSKKTDTLKYTLTVLDTAGK